MEALLTTSTARKPGMSIEIVRLFQYPIAIIFALVVVFMWVGFFLKLPRLELTSRSIKYLTFRYSLEAAWEDIERIEMFTRTEIRPKTQSFKRERVTVNTGRGLVASKYNFQLTKWGRLIQNYWYPKYQGIPIEPYFASNIYLGDLRSDMKQSIPRVFEDNPYLV